MGLIDEARDAVRDGLCSVLNTTEAIRSFGTEIGFPGAAPPDFPGTTINDIINSGQGLFCDRQPQQQPLDYVGGQCDGTIYSASWTITDSNGPRSASDSLFLTGPLGAIYRRENPQSPGNFQVVINQKPGLNPRVLASRSGDGTLTVTDFTLTLPVQGPNNCGNRPVTPLPEADRTAPVTIRNINGTVIFAFPTLNINGDLQVGFTLDVGELNVSGTVELNTGDIAFNFGGQPTDPGAPQVPTPDADVPTSEDDDPDEEKPANIIGVVVVSQENGNAPATELSFPNSPNVLTPRTATVQFKIRIKNKSHWTSEIPVRSRNSYIHCPSEIDAIDVVVTSDPGWIVFATPVRGIVPSNQVELL